MCDYCRNRCSVGENSGGQIVAINIFEGARRIAKLVTALWVIGWIVAAFNTSSSVYVTYQIAIPGEVPIRVESGCDYSVDATEHLDLATSKGTNVSLTLCFKHSVFDDGKKLIPYRIDKDTNRWWGNEEYTTEVSSYTESVASNFKLSKSDEEWIDAQWWSSLLKELGIGALVAIGGLLFLWAFTWVVGWIVRGFKGIPQGQDLRENKVDIP